MMRYNFTGLLQSKSSMLVFASLAALFGSGQLVKGDINLVTDGSFETEGAAAQANSTLGTVAAFTDWTVTDPIENGHYIHINNAHPFSGTYAAELGPDNNSSIKQTLSTVAGQQYELSYELETGDHTGDFGVSFDGTFPTLTIQPNGSNYGTYFPFSDTFTATSSSTVLTFGFQATGSYEYLDSVSVVALPEPASMSVVGIACVGLLARRRRSR